MTSLSKSEDRKTTGFWSDSARLFIAHALIYLQTILLVPVVIKISGAAVFGSVSLVLTLAGFAFGISSFGVGFHARRRLPSTDTPHDRRQLFYPQFWFQAVSLLCLSVLLEIFLPKLLTFLGANETVVRVAGGSVVAYLTCYLVYAQLIEYCRFTHRIGVYTFAGVAYSYLYLIFAVLIHWSGRELSVTTLIAAQTLSAAIVGLTLSFFTIREIGFHLTFPEWTFCRKDIQLGLPLMLTYFVETILAASDRFVIAGVLSVKEVGYYIPAYTLAMFILILPKTAGVILPVRLARAVDTGEQRKAEDLIGTLVRMYLGLSIPFAAGTAVLGRAVLELYANSEVAQAAWGIVPIVAVGGIFYGLIQIYGYVLSVHMKTQDIFGIIFLAALINVVLNLALLPIFQSILVPAYTTLATYMLAYFILMSRVRKIWRFEFYLGHILRVVIATALMSTATFVVFKTLREHSSPMKLSIGAAFLIALVVYSGACCLLGIIHRRDIHRVLRTLLPRSQAPTTVVS